jgi:hypothetical protein
MISREHIFLGLGLIAVLALVGLMAISVLAGTGGALATVAEAAGDDDRPISGEARDKCIAAALAEHSGGRVTETEVGDDGAAYEVEIRREDGSQVEVQLNGDCQVIGQEADDDSREADDD